MSPRLTTTSEAAQFAASLPETFLRCRDLGHSWRHRTARWDGDLHCYIRTLGCVSCATERVQHLSATGHVLSGHYNYPDGYQHVGLGRLDGADRDALRLESVVRVSDVVSVKRARWVS